MGRVWCALVGLALLVAPAGAQRAPGAFRVLSWNVSGLSPVERADSFRGHLRLAEPDILLLDEVEGTMSPEAFRQALQDPRAAGPAWHTVWGARGGRQRIVMAARTPLTPIEAFQKNTYPGRDIEAVVAAAPADAKVRIRKELAHGIPVNASTLEIAGRRLLLVAVDLQCCGGEWQEVRRLAEARQVRRLVDDAIRAVQPHGVILAGDFNLAVPSAGEAGIGALPLVVLSGPYAPSIHGLIAAEARQRDGRDVWTINSGANSPFPHMPFDFQLYSPHTLRALTAEVMDTADYPAAELKPAGLYPAASRDFSDHLPVVVTYDWRGIQ